MANDTLVRMILLQVWMFVHENLEPWNFGMPQSSTDGIVASRVEISTKKHLKLAFLGRFF